MDYSFQTTQRNYTDIRNSRNSALFAKWTRAQSARHRIKIWKRQNPWALSQFAINKETEFKKAFLFMPTERNRSTFLPIYSILIFEASNTWKKFVKNGFRRLRNLYFSILWILGCFKKTIKESRYIGFILSLYLFLPLVQGV